MRRTWINIIGISIVLCSFVLGLLENMLAPIISIPAYILIIFAGLTIGVVAFLNQKLQKLEQPQIRLQTHKNVVAGVLSETTPRKILVQEKGRPSIEKPLLISLLIDVSDSMKDTIFDYTGNEIKKYTSVQNAIEHFIHQGVALVKDPETQEVLPYYYLMSYGFGFEERAFDWRLRSTKGGEVRDFLAHSSLPHLPSAFDLSRHWEEYQREILSYKKYTADLLGASPLCAALRIVKLRIEEERKLKEFTDPVLLLIVSDGKPTDGDPLPIIQELRDMDVLILSCYLANRDVVAPKRLYDHEESHWPESARLLYQCASLLYKNTYVSSSMFDYLEEHGWQPHKGVHLFAQVNHAQELGDFLEVLLQGSAQEN